MTAAFAAYPLWWFVGLLDLVLVPLAAVMLFYLMNTTGVRVPRGWGLWAFFVLCAGFSIVMIDELGALIGFTYRYLLLLAVTILFVYLYNARRHLTDRYLLGLLTLVWVAVVAGGYPAMVIPDATWRTPMAYVLDVIRAAAPGSAIIFDNDSSSRWPSAPSLSSVRIRCTSWRRGRSPRSATPTTGATSTHSCCPWWWRTRSAQVLVVGGPCGCCCHFQ